MAGFKRNRVRLPTNALHPKRSHAYYLAMNTGPILTPHPIIILAGGQALRMGGGDKCLLDMAGRTILRRVIDRLQSQPIALSANGDPARFTDYALPVLPDTLGFDAGPLAGVLAGLDWAATFGASALISVPGDTPFLPQDLVARLTIGATKTGTAIAASPDTTGRLRRHPTCALWAVSRRHALRSALGEGLRKVGLWADLEHAATVAFDSTPIDPFFNINAPDDLARAVSLSDAI